MNVLYKLAALDIFRHNLFSGLGRWCGQHVDLMPPFTSAWPHLRCDVGLEEGEYRENRLCLAVLCIIIMVHKDTSSSYRAVNCIGL